MKDVRIMSHAAHTIISPAAHEESDPSPDPSPEPPPELPLLLYAVKS